MKLCVKLFLFPLPMREEENTGLLASTLCRVCERTVNRVLRWISGFSSVHFHTELCFNS